MTVTAALTTAAMFLTTPSSLCSSLSSSRREIKGSPVGTTVSGKNRADIAAFQELQGAIVASFVSTMREPRADGAAATTIDLGPPGLTGRSLTRPS